MARNTDPKPASGALRADGLRFGVVVSRFNSSITERLRQGALEALASTGATGKQIEVLEVPGSFEIPLAAKKLAESGNVQAVIAIGCVLRGETSHYDHICSEVARGIQLAQLDTGVPIIFCVLTCDTLEQAVDRAGPGGGNKGHEAGLAAVEMATLSQKLKRAASKPSKRPESSKRKSRGKGR